MAFAEVSALAEDFGKCFGEIIAEIPRMVIDRFKAEGFRNGNYAGTFSRILKESIGRLDYSKLGEAAVHHPGIADTREDIPEYWTDSPVLQAAEGVPTEEELRAALNVCFGTVSRLLAYEMAYRGELMKAIGGEENLPAFLERYPLGWQEEGGSFPGEGMTSDFFQGEAIPCLGKIFGNRWAYAFGFFSPDADDLKEEIQGLREDLAIMEDTEELDRRWVSLDMVENPTAPEFFGWLSLLADFEARELSARLLVMDNVEELLQEIEEAGTFSRQAVDRMGRKAQALAGSRTSGLGDWLDLLADLEDMKAKE